MGEGCGRWRMVQGWRGINGRNQSMYKRAWVALNRWRHQRWSKRYVNKLQTPLVRAPAAAPAAPATAAAPAGAGSRPRRPARPAARVPPCSARRRPPPRPRGTAAGGGGRQGSSSSAGSSKPSRQQQAQQAAAAALAAAALAAAARSSSKEQQHRLQQLCTRGSGCAAAQLVRTRPSAQALALQPSHRSCQHPTPPTWCEWKATSNLPGQRRSGQRLA